MSIWDQASRVCVNARHLCCSSMSKHLNAGTELWLQAHTLPARSMLPSLWVAAELNLLKGWTLEEGADLRATHCLPATHTHSIGHVSRGKAHKDTCQFLLCFLNWLYKGDFLPVKYESAFSSLQQPAQVLPLYFDWFIYLASMRCRYRVCVACLCAKIASERERVVWTSQHLWRPC